MCIYWMTINTESVDGFDIVLSIAPEDEDPRDNFDDDGETAQAIADGRYDWFMARVEAKREGIVLGTEYLGGCCYINAHDFLNESDYYGDMRAQAIAEAQAALVRATGQA
jgi:hypothetical protein